MPIIRTDRPDAAAVALPGPQEGAEAGSVGGLLLLVEHLARAAGGLAQAGCGGEAPLLLLLLLGVGSCCCSGCGDCQTVENGDLGEGALGVGDRSRAFCMHVCCCEVGRSEVGGHTVQGLTHMSTGCMYVHSCCHYCFGARTSKMQCPDTHSCQHG